MANPNFVLLYVADPIQEAANFYAPLLNRKPVESSPGYAMFVLENGFKIGFWKRDDVQPAAEGEVTGSDGACFCGGKRGSSGRALFAVDSQRLGIRPATHPHGIRIHVRSTRSRWASAAGVQACAISSESAHGDDQYHESKCRCRKRERHWRFALWA